MPKRPLVAIVDDDDSFRCALGNLVRALGYSTLEYCSAEAFLGSEHTQEMDCVIADVHMPAMSGFQLLDRLLVDPQGLPVILITAQHRCEARNAVLRRGAREYLPKPIPEQQLVDCLRELVG